MRVSIRDLIAQYLSEANLMQLSTCVDGQPWVCSVWFAADEDLDVFWFSSVTRRHSIEVTHNPRVAAAIALPQSPDQSPRGLQLQGLAQALTGDADIGHARKHLEGRAFTREKIDAFLNHSERPHKFYRIRASRFVLFDVVNFPDNPRQELSLPQG